MSKPTPPNPQDPQDLKVQYWSETVGRYSPKHGAMIEETKPIQHESKIFDIIEDLQRVVHITPNQVLAELEKMNKALDKLEQLLNT